uniref:Uncharacterized protein n=1 Tax=Glossina brevipalpis TaxID=37001 RepID=A0A1A9WSF6_9MUSC
MEENSDSQINECSSIRSEVSATELAAARAEIWLLTKKFSDAQISIENLESLLKLIIDKQSVLLSELYELKRVNAELKEECRMQRDYHTVERNAMIRELHNIKTLFSSRAALLEEATKKNNELTNAVQDAHEKIYVVEDLLGESWIKLSTPATMAGVKSLERITPLPFSNGEKYLRLLPEADRESNPSSHVSSASFTHSRKSPPNSPNTEFYGEDELKNLYINYWHKTAGETQKDTDWLDEWNSRPDQRFPKRLEI